MLSWPKNKCWLFQKANIDHLNQQKKYLMKRNVLNFHSITRYNLKWCTLFVVPCLYIITINIIFQTESLQCRNDILENALLNDKHDSEKVIQSLQTKIRQLQHHMSVEIDDARKVKSQNNISIRGEIEFIKRLLTEEEKR